LHALHGGGLPFPAMMRFDVGQVLMNTLIESGPLLFQFFEFHSWITLIR
jgi:hypothetical protein